MNGCVTNGMGCVKLLQSCITYSKSYGCPNLFGSDGNCMDD